MPMKCQGNSDKEKRMTTEQDKCCPNVSSYCDAAAYKANIILCHFNAQFQQTAREVLKLQLDSRLQWWLGEDGGGVGERACLNSSL